MQNIDAHAQVVTMPSFGETMTEGTVARWLRRAGDRVAAGEVIAEIVTDKVSEELVAPIDGTLGPLLVSAGQTASTGTALASIVRLESTNPPLRAANAAAGTAVDQTPDGQGWSRSPQTNNSPADAHARSSPLVRRIADEHRIDLSTVVGTGPSGRVTKDDILASVKLREVRRSSEAPVPPPNPSTREGVGLGPAASGRTLSDDQTLGYTQGPSTPAQAPAPSVANQPQLAVVQTPSFDSTPQFAVRGTVLAPSSLRQSIAANLVRAVQGVPQAWTMVEVDASALLAYRDAWRPTMKGSTGIDLGVFPTFAFVASRALANHPLLNSAWQDGPNGVGTIGELGGRIVTFRDINLGIAVARPSGGLFVPVVRDVIRLDLASFAAALDTAINGARDGTLRADEYTGGTVTFNNTGALGSVISQPILPANTSAILTFEAIVKRPVVVSGDAIAVRPIVNVCLTFDHRVLDGLEACGFLQDLKQRLESLDTVPIEPPTKIVD